jgi:hypothetical protein
MIFFELFFLKMLICTEGLFWNDETFGWALGFYREAIQAIALNVRQLTAEFTVYI